MGGWWVARTCECGIRRAGQGRNTSSAINTLGPLTNVGRPPRVQHRHRLLAACCRCRGCCAIGCASAAAAAGPADGGLEQRLHCRLVKQAVVGRVVPKRAGHAGIRQLVPEEGPQLAAGCWARVHRPHQRLAGQRRRQGGCWRRWRTGPQLAAWRGRRGWRDTRAASLAGRRWRRRGRLLARRRRRRRWRRRTCLLLLLPDRRCLLRRRRWGGLPGGRLRWRQHLHHHFLQPVHIAAQYRTAPVPQVGHRFEQATAEQRLRQAPPQRRIGGALGAAQSNGGQPQRVVGEVQVQAGAVSTRSATLQRRSGGWGQLRAYSWHCLVKNATGAWQAAGRQFKAAWCRADAHRKRTQPCGHTCMRRSRRLHRSRRARAVVRR